jgi:DNA-binding transcriptional MerR regulator
VDDADAIYGPEELAERAGVSRRTVRYYVQRGLLPAPSGVGRGKHYGETHLTRLIQIRELQASGVPLEQVGARLDGAPEPALPEAASLTQSSWTRIVLSPDVELHLRGRRLSDAQISRLITQLDATLGGKTP